MTRFFPYRCGRLDTHEPHPWGGMHRNRYACTGRVITEGAWRDYADQQDAAELEDDLRAEADCG